MDCGTCGELPVPCGVITGIKFGILDESDKGKIAVTSIDSVSDVTDPKLGLPNRTHECTTCGEKSHSIHGGLRGESNCEGHFGIINFPSTILHPYFLSEVVEILNKICPECKSVRRDVWKSDSMPLVKVRCCKYCVAFSNEWYPIMKFKISSKDLFRMTSIMVEVSEKSPKKFKHKGLESVLPADYWDFIPKDPHEEETCSKPNRRVLSHTQVHHLLKNVDPSFIDEFVPKSTSLFLNSFLVTPNSHRLTEVVHGLASRHNIIFDERTRAYKKMVDFRGKPSELSARVLDTLKISKLKFDKLAAKESDLNPTGTKWVKEVILGKRCDRSFRMVVIGDPNLKLDEIGIPCYISEMLEISEKLNSWNWERLTASCSLRLLEKGEVFVRRKTGLSRIRFMDQFRVGDTIYRPLTDGDIVLINRPPSIHQHSLIAVKVKVLPINSVVSINPLLCSPLCGDFDGDCLHGYIPQSIDSKVELSALVALDQQLFNGQTGLNLLSFTQDSLTAAHLVTEDTVLLNRFQIQQLAMTCPRHPASPAVNGFWTGRQLFSMLLPCGFDFEFLKNNVYIRDGEILTSSEGSAWLREGVNNLFYSLLKNYESGKQALEFLHTGQEVLCEWLSMRGLSVSLSDVYLSPDSVTRLNMVDEVSCGLQEAEQICNVKQLMVDSSCDFLVGIENKKENYLSTLNDSDRMCYDRQISTALSQVSISAFKQVFRDIQGLAYHYSSRDNSLFTMLKAGSKGNLVKLVQHSMCLGLQHSLVRLSFRLPHKLSCEAWNMLKKSTLEFGRSFIPYAVIENSFITGLNPLECFVHSLMSRDSSFTESAAVPGTLHRRLMFFMRDICVGYDGTIRNAYGNQVVQFSYDRVSETKAGQPVGSLSACALSEAAYSALDQPISLLEKSPLLNLKNVLECGLRKFSADQTVSLFLSKKLGRYIHGYEHGALEVKHQLERAILSDIVSTVMILYSPQTSGRTLYCPWVCHFHVIKEIAKQKRLGVHSIIDALHLKSGTTKMAKKVYLPDMKITSNGCSCLGSETHEEGNDTLCITVALVESSKISSISLDSVRDIVIPILLQTVVKGFAEIKKVDILWENKPGVPKFHMGCCGELYLRVSTFENCARMNLWNAVLNSCIQIRDMIDWERSHPDDTNGVFVANGIDAAWNFFFGRLKSAVSDIGKDILPEHLVVFANCLSSTGEFVSLNAKGLSQQRQQTSISSPFLQACFSNPGSTLIKAGKAGTFDALKGSVEQIAWGKIPSTGTCGKFEILYSATGLDIVSPVDVYNVLSRQKTYQQQNPRLKEFNVDPLNKCDIHPISAYGDSPLEKISKSFLRSFFSSNDIQKLETRLKGILHKYRIDEQVSEKDKDTLMSALYFHPKREEKIGPGALEIKVGKHEKYKNTRCFFLKRSDGTVEDFSYHKCVHSALQIIAPQRAKGYQSRWSNLGSNKFVL